jgi:uncharacterized protein
MFSRNIEDQLRRWKGNSDRKPLLLRGARQVGKTTAVKLFAESFRQFIYLNLEKSEDAKPFRDFDHIEKLVEALFFLKNKDRSIKDTLIFIDEIQEEPQAVGLLRYFYEEFPELHVIAAGSLLETILDESVNMPVGRVEYLVMRPVSFNEFLGAMDESAAASQFDTVPLNDFAHDKLLQLFHTYALIGGMPQIVRHYAEHRDLGALTRIYESLIVSYINDVEKYARNASLTQIIRHCINAVYIEAGSRIKFQGFGSSMYGRREVGEALRTLEKAMLIHLVYPTVHTELPIRPDLKKSPRLQVLDTGMLNHFAGLQKSVLGATDLEVVYKGMIAEHIVGQEMLASRFEVLRGLSFWVRDKASSAAEIDYVIPYEDMLIPVEVKSTPTGALRSLHLFMDKVDHHFAVRCYPGQLRVDKIQTQNNKEYLLLNLPYYLVFKLEEYVAWFVTGHPQSIKAK